jgi:hypothetical protein
MIHEIQEKATRNSALAVYPKKTTKERIFVSANFKPGIGLPKE